MDNPGRFQPRRVRVPPTPVSELAAPFSARGITFAVEASDQDLDVKQLEITCLDVELVVSVGAWDRASSQRMQEIAATVWVLQDTYCAKRNKDHLHSIHRRYWDCIHSSRPFEVNEGDEENSDNELTFVSEDYFCKRIRMDMSRKPIALHPGQARGFHVHIQGDLADPEGEADTLLPQVGFRVSLWGPQPENSPTTQPELLSIRPGRLEFSLEPLTLDNNGLDMGRVHAVLHSLPYWPKASIQYRGVPQLWSWEGRHEFGPRFTQVAHVLLAPKTIKDDQSDRFNRLLLSCMRLVSRNRTNSDRPNAAAQKTTSISATAKVPPLPHDCLILILQMCGWDWFGDQHTEVWKKRGYGHQKRHAL